MIEAARLLGMKRSRLSQIVNADVVLRGRDAVGQEGVFTGQLSVTNSAGVPAATTAARITGANFKGSFKINNGAAQPVDDSYQPAK